MSYGNTRDIHFKKNHVKTQCLVCCDEEGIVYPCPSKYMEQLLISLYILEHGENNHEIEAQNLEKYRAAFVSNVSR